MIDYPGVEFNLGPAQVGVLNQSPCRIGRAHLYPTKSRDSIEAGMAFKNVHAMPHVGRDDRRDSRIDENKKINRNVLLVQAFCHANLIVGSDGMADQNERS